MSTSPDPDPVAEGLGEWVLDPIRRVLVFKKDTPPIKTVDRVFPRRWSSLGPCPTCKAEKAAPCLVPSGVARRPHAARVNAGKRWCQEGCGAELTGHYKQRYCTDCATERKRKQDAAAFARFLERKRAEEAA